MIRHFVGVAAILAVTWAVGWDQTTPLDEYVHRDDGAYTYEVLAEHRYNACTVYVVNMTSQKWTDESFVDRPYWYHWMGIAVPDQDNLTYPDAGFLFINGGSNDNTDEPPGRDDGMNFAMCVAALDLGTVGAYINEVPNQPLYFANDVTNKRRSEDSLIAWTWRTFLDEGMTDPEKICRMPMTKAAKRGLDTINAVANSKHPNTNVTRFMVIGASKRGWTTWSLAAVDKRVIAAAPLVFSMLKFNETLMSHFRSLGGAWSFAFEPYYAEGLTRELLNPESEELFRHEDMWYYRERFTMPLLQMVSTGDEFFLLQDSHHWWNDIPDPKWTYMLENAEHAMFPHYLSLYSTATRWYSSILEGVTLPTVTWDRGIDPESGNGFIEFNSDMDPDNVTVYRAVTLRNDTRRDFRLATGNDTLGIEFHPVLWTQFNSNLTKLGPGAYRATTTPVDDEWVGFLVQGTWRDPDDGPMYLTSETQIIPDTFPVEPCTDPDSCYGSLI